MGFLVGLGDDAEPVLCDPIHDLLITVTTCVDRVSETRSDLLEGLDPPDVRPTEVLVFGGLEDLQDVFP